MAHESNPMFAPAKSAIVIINPTEDQLELHTLMRSVSPAEGSNVLLVGYLEGKIIKTINFGKGGGMSTTDYEE